MGMFVTYQEYASMYDCPEILDESEDPCPYCMYNTPDFGKCGDWLYKCKGGLFVDAPSPLKADMSNKIGGDMGSMKKFMTYEQYAKEFDYEEMLNDEANPCLCCVYHAERSSCEWVNSCKGGLYIAITYPDCKDNCLDYKARGHCSGCNIKDENVNDIHSEIPQDSAWQPEALRMIKHCDCDLKQADMLAKDPEQRTYPPEDTRALPTDKQEGGSHYKNYAIQPTEYIEKNKMGFCAGNIVKYATRFKDKNGLEDVKKIKHYAELLAWFEYGEVI